MINPWTGHRLTYNAKLVATRSVLSRLNLAPAAHVLFPSSSVPEQFFLALDETQLFTEHGARGLLSQWGRELGIPSDQLQYLGRWSPQSGPEDYVRSSRALVVKVQLQICSAVQRGWRPDESHTRELMESRLQHPLSIASFTFGMSGTSAPPPPESGPGVLDVTPVSLAEVAPADSVSVPAVGSTLDTQHQDSSSTGSAPGEVQVMSTRRSAAQPVPEYQVGQSVEILVSAPPRKPKTLHALRPEVQGCCRETLCGRVVGRTLLYTTLHQVRWPQLGAVVFDGVCGAACLGPLAVCAGR